MSLLDYRIGLAGGDLHLLEARQAPTSCNLAAGDLYQYPNATSTVDASQPVTFKWNTACSGISSTVDLYLYSSGSTGLIQAFRGLSYAQGSYTATLLPKWWNSTTTAHLQVNLVNSGGMSWATTGPAGPVWQVTYPESAMFQTVTDQGGAVKTSTAAVAAATNSGDAIIQNVTNTEKPGLAKGAIAAAVIVPLIALAALAAVAVRFWRQREAEKRRRWSQALSHHSAMEWEKGARTGEKTQSILGRPSLSTYMRGGAGDGGGRASMATSSVYAVENNMAGAGAAGLVRPNMSGLRSVSADNVNGSNTSVRSSVVMPNGDVRQSRISFAESARPDRRSRMSFGGDIRAPNAAVFKLPAGSRSATELVTPRGKASGSAIVSDDEDDLNISPTQRDGPSRPPKVAGGIRTGARRSVMSLVGGGDKRRESTASALSQQDFRSAVDAGGSVDELRDLEAMMLSRRSVISQYSANRASSYVESGSPALGYGHNVQSQYSDAASPVIPQHPDDNDRVEDLSHSESSQSMSNGSYFKPLPSAASTSTVAYGPDHMLAVYAARAAAAKSPPGSAGSGMNVPAAPFGAGSATGSTGKKGGMKILTSFGRKESESAGGYADVQRESGAHSPTTAPSPNLRVPPVVMTRQRSGTVGRGGQPNTQGGDDVGHAQ